MPDTAGAGGDPRAVPLRAGLVAGRSPDTSANSGSATFGALDVSWMGRGRFELVAPLTALVRGCWGPFFAATHKRFELGNHSHVNRTHGQVLSYMTGSLSTDFVSSWSCIYWPLTAGESGPGVAVGEWSSGTAASVTGVARGEVRCKPPASERHLPGHYYISCQRTITRGVSTYVRSNTRSHGREQPSPASCGHGARSR